MSELTAVSLFAGIEGIGLALERCGIAVKASVEIDAECRGVIARHFPQVKLFNDVRTVTGDELRAAGFVPERGILTGGFPCQDLSIAGRRAGLSGARSGLFWEIMRLADDLSPRWLILENVPGLLSAVCSCPGDDACTANDRAVRCGEWRTRNVAGSIADLEPDCPVCHHDWDFHDADGYCSPCGDTCDLPAGEIERYFVANVPHGVKGGACAGGCMPAHGGAMGTVVGALGKRGYGFAGRVLDSQFFGVPQRRERVFIVGCLGDWAAPVEILLEPQGRDRDLAPRSEAGQSTPGCPDVGADQPGVTGTLTAGMLGDYDDNTARAGFMVAHTTGAGWWTEGAGTLRAQGGGTDQGGHLVTAPTLTAGWGTNHGAPGYGGKDDAALAVTAATLQGGGRRGHRIDAEGAAGGHLIPLLEVNGRVSDNPSAGTGVGSDGDPMFTLQAGKQHGIAATLRSHPRPGSADPGAVVAHAITARESKGADSDATSGIIVTASHAVPVQDGRDMAKAQNGLGVGGEGDPAYTEDTTGAQAVAFSENQRGELVETPTAHQLTTGGGKPGQGYPAVRMETAAAVRRLTPLECERLQAFPDEWTRWRLVNGELVEQSDSARYRQLGNAVTVNVPEWIAHRLVAADLARGSEAGAA